VTNLIGFTRIIYRIASLVYLASGKKPWKYGYYAYKRNLIDKYIREKAFSIDNWPDNYGFRVDERIIEYPWLFSRLNKFPENILDAGSVLNYDYLIESSILSRKKLFISTLAPERSNYIKKGISYIFEDLRDSCFKDNYFDSIVSLSTIEHIGLDNTFLYTKDLSKKEMRPRDYLLAINEYKRMLKHGGRLFLSVPFGRPECRGWYQVFDQEKVLECIDLFSPSSVECWYFRYYPDGWQTSTAEECADAITFDIHTDKCYEDDFVAFSRAVCCIELVK
jgi:SAM-dependent methyltransferase